MTYVTMKKIIEKGAYNKEEVKEMLDVFYAGKRITKEQYKELTALVDG
jgi:hypothetical protein